MYGETLYTLSVDSILGNCGDGPRSYLSPFYCRIIIFVEIYPDSINRKLCNIWFVYCWSRYMSSQKGKNPSTSKDSKVCRNIFLN